ncbi:hypothetical protein HHI36_018998, partial [Cryptolaemus montrouzieri]
MQGEQIMNSTVVSSKLHNDKFLVALNNEIVISALSNKFKVKPGVWPPLTFRPVYLDNFIVGLGT